MIRGLLAAPVALLLVLTGCGDDSAGAPQTTITPTDTLATTSSAPNPEETRSHWRRVLRCTTAALATVHPPSCSRLAPTLPARACSGPCSSTRCRKLVGCAPTIVWAQG